MSAPVRTVSAEAVDDIVLPFAVEGLSTRGRLVRLGPAIHAVLERHGYPEPVSKLLAEAATLAILLGSTLKEEGRFQLQTKSDGPVSMLLVDFDAPSNVRALARFDRARVARAASGDDLVGHGHLAFTIDPGGDLSRYQGVVALEGLGLEAAAHSYFERSEQIPTLVRLAVGETVTAAGRSWRAGGLIVQHLPSAGPGRRADFHPGDAPEGTEPHRLDEDDAWTEAKALASTTEAHELIDPTLSAERLLFRLFNERGVRVFEPTRLAAQCRCSAEGVDAMLRSFPPEEIAHMVGDDGMIGVTCEFCSTKRVFNPADYGVSSP
ncbi:molecular chaperone Hsp33 [Roseiarcus fermentans]|uniref:Molecular chaperone Hsp33 n=1 Tax=Roseiarcus fermentans TaxID=1473586 RepID=A0A366EIU2_9HYPH|nr:Hsp33 family molecular chaperone [Roseiarcus fermentans]RBP02332.1 molecular chaperone Hsp33 [Roseiarcus fermentans]